jgi:hypothetical protein
VIQKPRFFKEVPLQVQLQGELRLLHFAAGFSKAVDPLSGMTVNLARINQWLNQLASDLVQLNFSNALEFLSWARDQLQIQAQLEKAQVTKVQARFFDRSVLILEAGSFHLQKSQECLVGDSKDQESLKIAQIQFWIRTPQDLQQAFRYSIPSRISATESTAISEIEKGSHLSIQQLELSNPLSKTAEIFSV